MKKETKMSGFKRIAASTLSTVVLGAASTSSATACMVVFYQPKTPQNIQIRLAKIGMK